MSDAFTSLHTCGCPTLAEAQISNVRGGYNRPYLAILEGSEEPTQEEVNTLSHCITVLCKAHGGKPGSAGSSDALIYLVKKVNGNWHGRHAGGTPQEFSSVEALYDALQLGPKRE
ncbi:MAG: hypothetical protein AAB515_03605 [Patescibacteria group bacterium]